MANSCVFTFASAEQMGMDHMRNAQSCVFLFHIVQMNICSQTTTEGTEVMVPSI